MSNTTRWVIDTNWTSAGFTASDFNSLANGSGVLASSAITNSTPLDMLMDVSFSFANGATTTGTGSFFVLYLLPLNQDGSTYGDGYASGSTSPVASYAVASCLVKNGITSGGTLTGTFRGIVLPPGDFKLAIVNQTAGALNASAAATVKYRSYNENLNA